MTTFPAISERKVATYRHVYRAEPKEPTKFGSVSGSEIQNGRVTRVEGAVPNHQGQYLVDDEIVVL